jgi:hypothetical protein
MCWQSQPVTVKKVAEMAEINGSGMCASVDTVMYSFSGKLANRFTRTTYFLLISCMSI